MRFKNICGGCFRASPVFCGEIQELVRRYSDTKQRFDPSIIAGAVRCRFGHIQVLVCRPFSRSGRPFPTTFWLTCPHLSRLAGRIEAEHGVHELEGYMRANNLGREWREYSFRHQVIRLRLTGRMSCRFIRRYRSKIFRALMRSGIGGMRQGGNISVKCLHLQTASFIAMGNHPAGEWLKAKGLCGYCGECLCANSRLQ